MARALHLTHDELYEMVKLYDLLRDMDFELTDKQVDVLDRLQEMETGFSAEDVEQCIIDGNDYKDCVDHMVATTDFEEPTTALLPEGDLIAEVLQITALLGGTCTRQETLNSQGRSSKQIIIEYDVKQRTNNS